MTAPTQTTPEVEAVSGHGAESLSSFIQEMAELHLLQQESLAIMKLAAYATDAMRVLWMLERHADMSPALDATLKAVCLDWRNPGAIDNPTDLIVVALNRAIYAMQSQLSEADRLVAALGSLGDGGHSSPRSPITSPSVGGSLGGTNPPDRPPTQA